MKSLFLPWRLFVAGLVLFVVNSTQARQSFGYDAEAERRFTAAVRMFESGNYTESKEAFRLLAVPANVHQRTTAAYLMAAKSFIRLNEYTTAISLLNDFFNRFPTSSYKEDALYTLGIGYMMTRQHRQAATALRKVVDTGANDSLARLAEPLLYTLSVERLSSGSVRALVDEAATDRSRDLLTIALAERYAREGNRERSSMLLRQILDRRPPGPFHDRASSVLANVARLATVRIGVMLPLMNSFPSSPARPLAEEILEGATFAVEEYNAMRGGAVPATLDVRDTERDTTVVYRLVKEFAADERVMAVLGPMFSGEAAAAARASRGLDLPILSPTANASGIAAISPVMFQVNPDLSMHGRALARYAVQNLHLSTFAVIAPDDPNAQSQVDGFVAELRRLGATLVATQTYTDASDDLKDAFMKLRGLTPGKTTVTIAKGLSKREKEKFLRAGADEHLLDSLIRVGGIVPLVRLLGPDGRRIADSLDIDYKRPPTHDEDFVTPMKSVDALFMPVMTADDIGVIASQVSYFNISARLLGSAEWYDLSHLEQNKRYLRNVIFCSDSYTDVTDPGYADFRSRFTQSRKITPTKNVLFGYDTMRLMLETVRQGGTTRQAFMKKLGETRDAAGFRTTVSFSRGRVNDVLHILQYDASDIVHLGTVEVK